MILPRWLSRQRFTIGWVLLLCTALCAAAARAAEPETKEDVSTLSVEDPPDAALEQRLQDVFSQVEEFSGVRVEVQDGVVHLSGTALRSRTRERAEALASRFEGVLYVQNGIEEETDVSNRLAPAVQKLRDY